MAEEWTKALEDVKTKLADNKTLKERTNFDGGDPDGIFSEGERLQKEYERLTKTAPPEAKAGSDKEVKKRKELESQRVAQVRRKEREWDAHKTEMKEKTGNEYW
eukprot:CAMPEP_0172918282 /NCGR_PEP_ID=MMETSP1075-20121228/199852_1 /TAXON_ID=2916 /ORGANISM="Ceratium fusus, Strain PA161109" /LENGTH=103 /DNA_ID=CAMNT_0013777897 /DNA_START=20 /DNA_END=328 /DNA_ORIENTATION=+